MSTANGFHVPEGAAMAQDAVMARDLRALRAIPRAYVVHQMEGREPVAWPVRSVMDMKDREVKALFDTDEIKAEGPGDVWAAETRRLHARLKLVCPAMTDDVLNEMTRTEKVAFWLAASQPTAPDPHEEVRRILQVAASHQQPCVAVDCIHPRQCAMLRKLQALLAEEDATPPPDPLALSALSESMTLPPAAGLPSAGPSTTPTS